MKARPKPRRRVFVLGGKAGDTISMLGCFHRIFLDTGVKPIVFCSTEFSSVYDGVSYVDARPVNAHWWTGLPDMEWEAIGQYGGATIVQPWHEPEWSLEMTGPRKIVLLVHGKNILVDIDLYPDAGSAMARRCGFTRDEWLSFPTVFDKRNPEREQKLIDTYIRPARERPVLLYNLKGISSPFGYEPECYNALRTLVRDFRLIDLSAIRAERIFDLLGLFDNAAGLLTCDNALLHLAAASKVPLIALTQDGWSGSIARGNVILSTNYSDSINRLPEIMELIKGLQPVHA